MPDRHRETLQTYAGYRIKNSNGALSYSPPMSVLDGYVDDVTGPGDNAPFTLERIALSGHLINGKESSHITGYEWFDYPTYYQLHNSIVYSHISQTTQSDTYYASQLLSRTSPERPSTNALVAMWEAREIPGLLKELYEHQMDELGKFIPKKAFKALKRTAKYNLMIQFGILPVFSDLKTCLDFQSLVDSRVKELERLREPRGLRRTKRLDTIESSWTSSNKTIQSNDVILHCKFRKSTTTDVRGHIRWYLDENYTLSDSSIRRVARKAILGAYLDPYTLYEAMPWSWLIDYFTNLGDFVHLNRNSLAAHHNTPRIMRNRRTVTTSYDHDTAQSGKITCTPCKNVYETKTRRLATASLSARVGFLTENQTSILGSLAFSRGHSGLGRL